LRIPKAFAEEASLEDESVVDLKVVNGKLVVASVVEPEVTLDQLLADVKERNLHGEVTTGVPIPARMKVSGAVLSDQMNSMDWRALDATLICRLPEATVSEVLRKAATLLSK